MIDRIRQWSLNTSKTQILDEKGQTVANINPHGAISAQDRDEIAELLVSAPNLLAEIARLMVLEAWINGLLKEEIESLKNSREGGKE